MTMTDNDPCRWGVINSGNGFMVGASIWRVDEFDIPRTLVTYLGTGDETLAEATRRVEEHNQALTASGIEAPSGGETRSGSTEGKSRSVAKRREAPSHD